jgi:hypothetical protein
MPRIKQALVAQSLSFFKKSFLSRWDLQEYYDPNEPCVFFGGQELSKYIQDHNGIKIIIPATPNDMPDFSIVTNRKNMFIISPLKSTIPSEVICKDILIQIKDYSLFQPNILGDKIYFYSGFKNGYDEYHKHKQVITQIENQTGYEIITTAHMNLKDFFDIDYLKVNFYDKSFLNLNLSKEGNHLTTAIELGMMGRKTIMKKNYQNFSFMIDYIDLKNIISIIKEESKKIGTIQPSINSDIISTDKWLNTDYWLKSKNNP